MPPCEREGTLVPLPVELRKAGYRKLASISLFLSFTGELLPSTELFSSQSHVGKPGLWPREPSPNHLQTQKFSSTFRGPCHSVALLVKGSKGLPLTFSSHSRCLRLPNGQQRPPFQFPVTSLIFQVTKLVNVPGSMYLSDHQGDFHTKITK